MLDFKSPKETQGRAPSFQIVIPKVGGSSGSMEEEKGEKEEKVSINLRCNVNEQYEPYRKENS